MFTIVIAFVVVLGVLIFFHELGHFLVARLFGVGVEKFSLGFGPRLIGKKVGITEYLLSAVPLGGYVKMVGEDLDSEVDPTDEQLSFAHKHVLKRILIVAAGPLFNFLLATIIFFVFSFFLGVEDITPVIRHVEPDSPAYKAGLREGDRVVAVDGIQIISWSDINKIFDQSNGQAMVVQVADHGGEKEYEVIPIAQRAKNFFGEEITYYTIGISGFPLIEPVVGGLTQDFPAQTAGLQKGDRVLSINAESLGSWQEMSEKIASCRGQALDLTIQRGDEKLELSIKPKINREKNHLGEIEERYMIGISAAKTTIPQDEKIVRTYGLFQSLVNGVIQTYNFTELTIVSVVKLVQGSISPKTLGGPIMIAEMAGQQAKAGIKRLFFFIAILSINLAILNFLPIPVLDGGHLLFFFIELLIGRPINLRMREIAQQIGLFILIMLMVFVIYNDITRIFFS